MQFYLAAIGVVVVGSLAALMIVEVRYDLSVLLNPNKNRAYKDGDGEPLKPIVIATAALRLIAALVSLAIILLASVRSLGVH